jgi:septum formation inhibitor MinC
MPAFPWEPAFQYGSQQSPQYQSLGQQKIPSLIMSVQPGQMAPHQHFEPQTQESVSDAPGVFVNPEDLMLDTQDLVNPQTNNILKSEIPQSAELVDSYNKLHEERRVQEARDRLAAQEKKDKAKAAEAEEMSQEEMDALWDQFMNPDDFK